MKMRKYRQTVRVSLLGLTMVMLMSAGVLFFNTHASEAVSGSDIQVSDSDTNQNELSKIVVNRVDSAEPRPTLARTPNIVMTVKGSNGFGIYVNKGSQSTFYVDWGSGSYVKVTTDSNGYYFKSGDLNGGASSNIVRISADFDIKQFSDQKGADTDHCYIYSFDASGCPNLEELDISGNGIVYTLDLSSNQKLKKLNCSNNQIQVLKLPHKQLLTEFDCSNNLLKPSSIDSIYGQKGTYVPQYSSSSDFDISISSTAPYDVTYEELAPENSITLTDTSGSSHKYYTTYKWYSDPGDTDVTSSVNAGSGKALFTYDNIGKYYYCVIKNNHFKDMNGNVCEWKTSSMMIVPPTYTFAMTLDDSFPTGAFYVGINSTAKNVFVDYGNGHGYYKRPSGDSVMAISASNVRYIRFYAENLTTITIPEGCIKELDLSNAGSLNNLTAKDNPSLATLDLTPCKKLVTVDVSGDGLTQLDLSGLTKLTTLDVSGNKLRFSGITKPASFKTGNYSNQNNGTIAVTNPVKAGHQIDFSAEYVDENSVYTWSNGANPTMNSGVAAFSTDNIGKTTACTITHPDYPGLQVKTKSTKVIPAAPVFTLTSGKDSGTFTFTLNNNAQKVYVDYGEGFVAKSAGTISGTLSGSTVKVYAENITSLSVPSMSLTGMDLSKLTSLEILNISGNPDLGMPDLSGNTALTSLNVSNNDLTSLDTSALAALQTLNASGNKLKFSTVTQPDGFTGGDYSNQDNEPIEITNPVKAGHKIDLSAEYVDERTVYTWNPEVGFQCADGMISFGDDAKGKTITGKITHPDYHGLEVNVTGIRVMPGFTIDDDGSGVTAEPEDDVTLEDIDGDPIDIDDVIIRIRHLTQDELAAEKAAITDKGYAVEENDTLDGYDISLVDRNGDHVSITSSAGIKITLPYGGIDRSTHSFTLYHNDTDNGIELIAFSSADEGIVFVGHRFSAYTFTASPKSTGNDDTSSDGDTTSSDGDTTSPNGDNTGSDKTNVPATGESHAMLSLAYLMLVISLAGVYFSVYMIRTKDSGENN